MDTDNESGFGPSDQIELAARGVSPFAEVTRTAMGKLALGLSLVPWATFGLMFVFQPG